MQGGLCWRGVRLCLAQASDGEVLRPHVLSKEEAGFGNSYSKVDVKFY